MKFNKGKSKSSHLGRNGPCNDTGWKLMHEERLCREDPWRQQYETAAPWQQRGWEISWAVVTGAGHTRDYHSPFIMVDDDAHWNTMPSVGYKAEIINQTKFSKRPPICLRAEVLVLWGEVERADITQFEAELAQEEVNTSPSASEDTARLPS